MAFLVSYGATLLTWHKPAILTQDNFQIDEAVLGRRKVITVCATLALALLAGAYLGTPFAIGVFLNQPFVWNRVWKNHERNATQKLNELVLKAFYQDNLNEKQLQHVAKNSLLMDVVLQQQPELLDRLAQAAAEAHSFPTFASLIKKGAKVNSELFCRLLDKYHGHWALCVLKAKRILPKDFHDGQFPWELVKDAEVARVMSHLEEKFENQTASCLTKRVKFKNKGTN